MEGIKSLLKNTLKKSSSPNKIYNRNLLKEYLQIFALDFIFAHPIYSELFFYGGSSLRHGYGLPRLSEDLDFLDMTGKIKIVELADDLNTYFNQKTDLRATVNVQKFHLTLKFPLLFELGLANQGESDLINLKVEVSTNAQYCRNFKTEFVPVFKANKAIIIKTFDLPTLMSTKIAAVINRRWEKTAKSGDTLATVKGRDYFDLVWYFSKGVKPNMACFSEDEPALKANLLEAVEKADTRSVRYDLEALIDNPATAENLSRNFKAILKKYIGEMAATE